MKKLEVGRNSLTEKQIESQILDYLNLIPGAFFIKLNNTGIFDPTKKIYRTLKNKHSPKGVSDIVGCLRGTAVFIEVKTPKTKSRVSVHQKEFLNKMKSAGAIAFVATSLDDIIKELNLGRTNDKNNPLSASLPSVSELF